MKHRSLLTTFTTCVTTLAFCGNALAAGGAPVFALRALAAGERNMQPRLPLDPAATRDQLIRLRSSALNGTLRNTLGT
ncbi:MAG: hypothetical protein WCG78_07125, partial [Candidatus Omnitrophota bacterium]